jgi:hypothetical protein
VLRLYSARAHRPALDPIEDHGLRRDEALGMAIQQPSQRDLDFDGGVLLRAVFIPPGRFQMGSPPARVNAAMPFDVPTNTTSLPSIPTLSERISRRPSHTPPL